jgi:phytoene dehydrogenase-like protein
MLCICIHDARAKYPVPEDA